MGPTFDLTRLVEELRNAGFKIDTRQYLTAHQFLLILASKEGRLLDGDLEALRTLLGPIFCTSSEEQDRFGEVLRSHLGARRPAYAPDEKSKPSPEPRRANYWKWLGVATVLISLTLGAAVLYRQYAVTHAPVEIHGRVETEPQSSRPPTLELSPGGKVELNADGTFLLLLAPADGTRQFRAELKGYDSATTQVSAAIAQPVVLTLRQSSPLVSTSELTIWQPRTAAKAVSTFVPPVQEPIWSLAVEWAIAVACLVELVLEVAVRIRRRLALFQYPIDKRPDFETLAVTDLSVPQLAGSSLRRVAAALRRQRATGGLEFDVLASVDGAARSGGLLQPVFVPRRILPEYLALIQRCDPEDHQAHLFEALLDGLQHHGVAIERYFFEEDPRVCFSKKDPTRPWRLAELVSRHHRASLLILSDVDTCFTPPSGKPARWLRTLKALPRSALLTPTPPAQWTKLEWKLAAEGLDVVPATEEGLAAYAGSETSWHLNSLFPAAYARPFPESLRSGGTRWLERYAPPKEELVLLERELQDYLGPDGFAWLAACAVYPGIAVPITLDMGQALLGMAGGWEQEHGLVDTLAALARLPWFRHGIMPEWLRRLLIARLTPKQETMVRRRMFERLDVLAQRTITTARNEGEAQAGLRISGWVGPLDLVNTAPPESSMGNAVFLAFMAGARFDSPVLEAPRRLRRLFDRLGWARLRKAALQRQAQSWAQRLRARTRTLGLSRHWVLRGAAAFIAGVVALGVSAQVFTIQSIPVRQVATLTAFAFSPDGSRMVVGRSDGVTDVFDVASGQMVSTFAANENEKVVVVSASKGAEQVATVIANRVVLRNGKTGAVRQRWEASAQRIPPMAIVLSPDQLHLATLAQDGRVYVDDLGTENSSQHGIMFGNKGVGFEANGAFVTIHQSGKVTRWQSADLDPKSITLDVESSFFSKPLALERPRLLPMNKASSLIIDENNPLRVWDAHSGVLIRELKWGTEVVVSATVSQDSKWVVAAASSGTIRLWSLADGSQLGELNQPGVIELDFAPDAKTLAAVTENEVRLWPLEEHTEMVTPVVPPTGAPAPITPPHSNADLQLPAAPVTRVPDVVGLDLQAADVVLKRAGLDWIKVTMDKRRAIGITEYSVEVLKQEPAPGTRTSVGNTVRLPLCAMSPRRFHVNEVRR